MLCFETAYAEHLAITPGYRSGSLRS